MPKIEPNNGLNNTVVLSGGPIQQPINIALGLGLGPGPGTSNNGGGPDPQIAGSSNNASGLNIINNTNGSGQGPGPGPGPGPGQVQGMQAAGDGTDMPQKKFPCHLCRRSFMHKQSLDIHMRSHTGKLVRNVHFKKLLVLCGSQAIN